MPTVTVIIPTYNRADMVGNAIQSVLNQTYQKWELTVVDDASEDNTMAVIEAYLHSQALKGKIKYCRLSKNSGSSARPRNIGIKLAKGKYLSFLDDDTYDSSFLQKMVAKMETLPSEVGVLYCGYRIAQGTETAEVLNPHYGSFWPRMLSECMCATCASLVRKECFKTQGLFEEAVLVQTHWDMWIRIAHDYHFASLDEVLSTYNVHDGFHQAATGNKLVRVANMLEKYRDWYAEYPEQLAKAREKVGLPSLSLVQHDIGQQKPLPLSNKVLRLKRFLAKYIGRIA